MRFFYKIWGSLFQRNTVKRALTRFFGCDAAALPSLTITLRGNQLADTDRALRSVVKESGGSLQTIGFVAKSFRVQGLRSLVTKDMFDLAALGAPAYAQVETGPDERSPVLSAGVQMVEWKGQKFAVLVTKEEYKPGYTLEFAGPTVDAVQALLEEVRRRAARDSVYRGASITVEGDPRTCDPDSISLTFSPIEPVERDELILPSELLNALERNSVGFFEQIDRLRSAKLSVRRGLLLYGMPGTGKTFTIRWLASAIPNLTVITLSGDQLWLIKAACNYARLLAPSMVVLEDVDLIAQSRDQNRNPITQVTLHQLMNEMDGIGKEAPVLFMLTTNRIDTIESAVASRPGRIDLAIEYPLPNQEDRLRLIELYAKGVELRLQDANDWAARTEGASPAFLKELVRKAALFAAEKQPDANATLVVTDAEFEAALRELVEFGGPVTRSLLGFNSTA